MDQPNTINDTPTATGAAGGTGAPGAADTSNGSQGLPPLNTDAAKSAPTNEGAGAAPDANGQPTNGEPQSADSLLGPGEENATSENEGAPESYDFTQVPEAVEMSEDTLAVFSEEMKALNVPQAAAEKALSRLVQAVVKQNNVKLAQHQQQWLEQTKADPYFAQDLEPKMAVVKKAADAFATPALRQLLNISMLGNHVEVLRMFHKIGLAMGEDSYVPSGGAALKAQDARALYPNSGMNP